MSFDRDGAVEEIDGKFIWYCPDTHRQQPCLDRKFDASALFPPDTPLEDIVSSISTYGFDADFTHLGCHLCTPCECCGRRLSRNRSIIVAVDGACKNNGHTNALAAVGVFFRKDSALNITDTLDSADRTSQRAELRAGMMTLECVWAQKHRINGLRQVIIQADSEYLVKGMTDWVFKWRENDYYSAPGTVVVNRDLFEDLDKIVGEFNERGVEVLFWHVPRRFNAEADALANKALDQYEEDYRMIRAMGNVADGN